MRNLLKIAPILFILSGCFSKDQDDKKTVNYFFDLKSYFSITAKKLNQTNVVILKSVSKNKVSETKKIKIKDWEQELALFIDADINKPAWKDRYTKDSSAIKIIYTAKDQELKTQKITIDMMFGEPEKIEIVTQLTNLLFQTKEHLVYYPDSCYRINKSQVVFLLGQNDYQITGLLKQ
jgi:hypothetical protein